MKILHLSYFYIVQHFLIHVGKLVASLSLIFLPLFSCFCPAFPCPGHFSWDMCIVQILQVLHILLCKSFSLLPICCPNTRKCKNRHRNTWSADICILKHFSTCKRPSDLNLWYEEIELYEILLNFICVFMIKGQLCQQFSYLLNLLTVLNFLTFLHYSSHFSLISFKIWSKPKTLNSHIYCVVCLSTHSVSQSIKPSISQSVVSNKSLTVRTCHRVLFWRKLLSAELFTCMIWWIVVAWWSYMTHIGNDCSSQSICALWSSELCDNCSIATQCRLLKIHVKFLR